MKVITRYRLADIIGTLYETSLKGRIHYEYRIRFKKQIVGRSYVYFADKADCLEHMKSDMEQIFDSSKLEFIK